MEYILGFLWGVWATIGIFGLWHHFDNPLYALLVFAAIGLIIFGKLYGEGII